MRGKRLSIGLRAILAIFTVALFVTSTWGETREKVLHSFNNNGTDGYSPQAHLIRDAAGNLYGTTQNGGTYNYGTAFELTPTADGGWTEKVLHSFNRDGIDGIYPLGGVSIDAAGNLYVTTVGGGIYCPLYYGCGTVIELTRSPSAVDGGWKEKVLHNFGSGTDGSRPQASLIIDAAGNLYGTTAGGGTHECGTVFELTPTAGGGWTEKVLYSFNRDGIDGAGPFAGLIRDAAGNLYGTTAGGGIYGFGTAFELTRSPNVGGGGWTEKVLHSFNLDCKDGADPFAGLIRDAAGNLYGTTVDGGTSNCSPGHGYGTVFELTPTAGGGWAEKVLYSFDGREAWNPCTELIRDAAGNLYGVTPWGGIYNRGSVFEMTPTADGGWTYNVFYSFNDNGTDGYNPVAGLIRDAAGNLYGTTQEGGIYSWGTVFEITP